MLIACSLHACVPITCTLACSLHACVPIACSVSVCMCKCQCRSVSVCSANVVEVSVCKCTCRSVSVQGIFRKNPSQCFREKDMFSSQPHCIGSRSCSAQQAPLRPHPYKETTFSSISHPFWPRAPGLTICSHCRERLEGADFRSQTLLLNRVCLSYLQHVSDP